MDLFLIRLIIETVIMSKHLKVVAYNLSKRFEMTFNLWAWVIYLILGLLIS